ncbi:MAG: lactate utilization protein [Oscillospiraceae bacterium]
MEQANSGIFKRNSLLAPGLIKALESRKFKALYCETAGEAANTAFSLIAPGSAVAWGGSVTLREIGLLDKIRQAGYTTIDRDEAETTEQRFELMRQALLSDVYLGSANAISEDGILVNVDSVGNRTAAITFGPKQVILVVGMNKVCKTAEEAEARARHYAAPVNAARLGLHKTPCAATGACANCKADECICSVVVKTRMCKIKGRIVVILVGEPLGY